MPAATGIAYNHFMSQRSYYIDRLRTAMTFIVLSAHIWMTYGSDGNWFYREIGPSRSLFSVVGTLYCLTNQAFLMGLFFLLAGYFTPASYDRKLATRFVIDRFLRLGLPLLAFGLVLAPLTIAMVGSVFGPGFWPSITLLWRTFNFENGPMWFAEALLFMSLGYSLWRVLLRSHQAPIRERTPRPVPSNAKWFLSAVSVGLASYIVRIWAPVDTRILGLWLGFFPAYIFLFVIGIIAWRHDWLSQLSWKQTRLWLVVAIATWPVLPVTAAVLKLRGHNPYLSGAGTLPSFLWALWEPFVAWGAIASVLMWFRTSFNQPSPTLDWLGRRAYAVYVIHPPVLVAICLFFRTWHAPAPLKFALVGTLGCAATWLAADPLVRLPGLKKIF